MVEESSTFNIKTEIEIEDNVVLTENQLKQEQDIPEYVNVNSFSDVKANVAVCEATKERYKCNLCRSNYKKAEYLTIHSAVHDPQRTCPVCHEKFTCKKKLSLHLNKHIKDHKLNTDVCEVIQEWHQCNQCYSKYEKAEYLVIHSAVHEPERSCPVCCEKFTCKRKFGFHLSNHIRNQTMEEGKVTYKCDYCEKRFESRKGFTVHIRVHTNERPHKCEICGEGFKQIGALRGHYVTHTKERPFVCEVCNGSFTTSSSLKRHQRRLHDKGKTINCKVCNAIFLNMADFRVHRTEVHPEAGFRRTCPICFEVFRNKRFYRIHKQTHGEQKAPCRSYMCALCGKKYNTSDYLKHLSSHIYYSMKELEEAIKKNLFSCKFCAKEVKSKKTLLRHMDTHMEKKFKCKLCENLCTYLGLRVHMRAVHQIFRCQACHKELPGKISLRSHYKKQHPTLMKQKQFNCSVCGRKYMLKHALAAHYKLMHEQNEVKSFICGESCPTNLVLSAHMSCHKELGRCTTPALNQKGSSVSKKQNEQSQSKNNPLKPLRKCFQCKACKKIFRSSMNYKNHIAMKACLSFLENVKTDLKCGICDKTLVGRDSLKKHMELHSSSHYKCRFCGKRFKQFQSVRLHLRRIHPGKQVFWCDSCNEGFKSIFYFKKHIIMHKMKLADVMGIEDCTDKILGVSCAYVKEVDVEGSNMTDAT